MWWLLLLLWLLCRVLLLVLRLRSCDAAVLKGDDISDLEGELVGESPSTSGPRGNEPEEAEWKEARLKVSFLLALDGLLSLECRKTLRSDGCCDLQSSLIAFMLPLKEPPGKSSR
jgi:hypothetical protein